MGVHKREYAIKGRPVWQYEFRQGCRRYTAAGFSTEREAKEAEERRRRELNSKHHRPVTDDRVTFEQFLPRFLAHRRVVRSAETAVREERRARPVLKWFGDQPLSRVTVADVHEYVARRKTRDRLKNRSANLELTLLRSVFRHAIECGFASENPAKSVTNLKEERDEKWIPTEEEFLRFVEAARKTASAVVFVPWLWFRAYTGTRTKESVFVEWADVDFEHDRISIRPKPGNPLKNATVRHVEIHPGLKPILLEWRRTWGEVFETRHRRHPGEPHPPHDWVFYNPHDQDARATSFFRCFYQARKAARLPKMTSHTLRHFFISQAVMSKDVSFYTIAKWVGHRGTRMIEDVYGHLRSDYRQEQMNSVRMFGTETNGIGGSDGRAPAPPSPAAEDRPVLKIVGDE
jgi:integrase